MPALPLSSDYDLRPHYGPLPGQGGRTTCVPRQGRNPPLPLKRSPPVSFKRLLGSTIGMVAATPPAPHTNTNEENQEQYGGGEEPAGRQPQDRTGQSRRSCLGNALDHWVHSVVLPNGSRLSCGRPARRRKAAGRSPCPARGTTLRFL